MWTYVSCNEEDAELCLGFKPDADVEAGHTDAEGYKGIFQQMMKEFDSNMLFLHCANLPLLLTMAGKL